MNTTTDRPSRRLRRPFLVHPTFFEQLEDDDLARFRPRLTHLLQLLASGESSRSKSTRGVNQGWLRAPLGGNSGYHYYLWWRDASVEQDGLRRRAVELWGIRHHDDTDSPLTLSAEPRVVDRWHELDGSLDPDAGLTAPQRAFVHAERPVRVLEGAPGSGKTSALWHALVHGDGSRILYLTFSDRLRDRAVAFLGAKDDPTGFLPPETDLLAMTLHEFIAALAGRDLDRSSVHDARDRFLGRLRDCPRSFQLLLKGDEAEARFYFDRLYPAVHSPLQGNIPMGVSSDPQIYADWKKAGFKQLDVLTTVFPDVSLGHEAHDRLGRADLPLASWLASIDCIAVDEAQDLTVLERDIVLRLWQRLSQVRDTPVALLVAGDEGQTVRPTGFQWSQFNQAVAKHDGVSDRHTLRFCHRAPERLFDVVQRAANLYQHVSRAQRPAGATALEAEIAEGADVLYGLASTREEWVLLVQELARQASTALLVFEPADLGNDPDVLELLERGEILLPETAKGLEFERVVVLGLAAHLERIASSVEHATRQARVRFEIDRLRVALSRATHVIAAVDLQGEPRSADVERLFEAPAVDADFLRGALLIEEPDAGDLALRYAADAQDSVESVPERAWRRALRAARLLTEFRLIFPPSTQSRVQSAVLDVVIDAWAAPSRDLPPGELKELSGALADPALDALLTHVPWPLDSSTDASILALFDLVTNDALVSHLRDRVPAALRRHRSRWWTRQIERLATSDGSARVAALPLDALLRRVVPDGDVPDRVRTLVVRAIDAAAREDRPEDVSAWSERVASFDPDAAIDALLSVGLSDRAVEVARAHGRHDRAVEGLRHRGELDAARDALLPSASSEERATLDELVALRDRLRAVREHRVVHPAELDALVRALHFEPDAWRRSLAGKDAALEAARVRLEAVCDEERERWQTQRAEWMALRERALQSERANHEAERAHAARELAAREADLTARALALDEQQLLVDALSEEWSEQEKERAKERAAVQARVDALRREEATVHAEVRRLHTEATSLQADIEAARRQAHELQTTLEALRRSQLVVPAATDAEPHRAVAAQTSADPSASAVGAAEVARDVPRHNLAALGTDTAHEVGAEASGAERPRWSSLKTVAHTTADDEAADVETSAESEAAEEASSPLHRLDGLRAAELCSRKELQAAIEAAFPGGGAPAADAAVEHDVYLQVRKQLSRARSESSLQEISSRSQRKRGDVEAAARVALGRAVAFDEKLKASERRRVIQALRGEG